jgi:uncharacterized protein YjiS (DUF1127 family)
MVMASVTGTCAECTDRVPYAGAPRLPWTAVRLADLLIEWLRRGRSRRTLTEMDDRMLHDIGLTRDAALAEGDKPFWRA